MKWSSGDENALGIDDKPIQRWGDSSNTQKRTSMWRYCRPEGRDPKDTDAVCIRKNQPAARGVKRGEAENLRAGALMHI